MQVIDLDGRDFFIGGLEDEGRHTLIFFMSPTCPVCETLLPTVMRMRTEAPVPLRLVLASDGEIEPHVRFRAEKKLVGCRYVLSPELGHTYAVAQLPYAVLMDRFGTVVAKGLVNTREHVESLFEAERLGVGSVQAYIERKRVHLEVVKDGSPR